jgi:hypothetical protein
METVTVGAPRRYTERGWHVVSAQVSISGHNLDIFFRSTHGPLTGRADPFLALALLPAMKLGAELRIEGDVSPRLLQHSAQIQDIVNAWYPEFSKIPISAGGDSQSSQPQTAPPGVACFFSGGVDSSYSLLKRQSELTHLIFVHGIDIGLQDGALWRRVAPQIQAAAGKLGKPLITVETNARRLLDDYTRWGEHSCGAALASVALALSPQVQTVYIAASSPYHVLLPLGSHPLLDPLWSSDQVELVHDGGEADRWQKLHALVSSRVALQWLRVCCQNSDLSYNCCLCRKCLEVMVYLEAAGVLAQCPTFHHPLDLDVLARTEIAPEDAIYTEALIADISVFGPHEQLVHALRASLSRPVGAMPAGAPLPAPDPGRLAELEGKLHESEAQAARLRAQIRAVQASPWWRWTEPLRTTRSRIHHWRGKQ